MRIPKHVVAVDGCILNDEGKILLKRHPARGWEFPGGKVEEGEDLIEALKREIFEETGVKAAIGQLTGVYSNTNSPTLIIFSFLCKYISGEFQTCDESLEIGWFSKSEVLEMITFPAINDRANDTLHFDGEIVYRVYGKAEEDSDDYKIHREYKL